MRALSYRVPLVALAVLATTTVAAPMAIAAVDSSDSRGMTAHNLTAGMDTLEPGMTYQSFTVPEDVTELIYLINGGEGGSSGKPGTNFYADGGRGTIAKGTVAVTPGEVLHLYPSEKGQSSRYYSDAHEGSRGGTGFTNGGNGGTQGSDGTAGDVDDRLDGPGGGGGGGGSSAIVSGDTTIVLAAGGGGAGGSFMNGYNSGFGAAASKRGGNGLGYKSGASNWGGTGGWMNTGNGASAVPNRYGAGGGGAGLRGGGAGGFDTRWWYYSSGGGGGGTPYLNEDRATSTTTVAMAKTIDALTKENQESYTDGNGYITLAWDSEIEGGGPDPEPEPEPSDDTALITIVATKTDRIGKKTPAAGWMHDVTRTGTEDFHAGLPDADGRMTVEVDGFDSTTDTKNFTISQALRDGWKLQDWTDDSFGVERATCTVMDKTRKPLTVTNYLEGAYKIDVPAGTHVTCTTNTVEQDPDIALYPSSIDLTTGETNPEAVAAGTEVEFNYVVANPGNMPIEIAVVDLKVKNITCPLRILPAGSSARCVGTERIYPD